MPDLPVHLWYSITSLGSAGMTLPLAFAIALWLAIGYTWRMAVGWLLLLGAAIGVVTVTKLAFLGWVSAYANWISPASAVMPCCLPPSIRSRCS